MSSIIHIGKKYAARQRKHPGPTHPSIFLTHYTPFGVPAQLERPNGPRVAPMGLSAISVVAPLMFAHIGLWLPRYASQLQGGSIASSASQSSGEQASTAAAEFAGSPPRLLVPG